MNPSQTTASPLQEKIQELREDIATLEGLRVEQENRRVHRMICKRTAFNEKGPRNPFSARYTRETVGLFRRACERIYDLLNGQKGEMV